MDKQQMEQFKTEHSTIETEINQLENRQKVLLTKKVNEERRQRNHRLIERGAMLESAFPELTSCENAGVTTFLIAVSCLPSVTDLLAKATQPSDTG